MACVYDIPDGQRFPLGTIVDWRRSYDDRVFTVRRDSASRWQTTEGVGWLEHGTLMYDDARDVVRVRFISTLEGGQ